MKYIIGLIKFILIVAAVLFCVFNSDPIDVVIFKGYLVYEMPKFLPALVAFFVGAVLASIVFICDRVKIGQDMKKLRRELIEANTNVDRMRNLPLVEESAIVAEKSEEIKEESAV